MEQSKEVVLEIADIANATQIMKIAIERSAFAADDMSAVAGVYDKFKAFMLQIEAQTKAEQEAQANEAEQAPAVAE